ncbi:unnamed protein product [Meloidogyne enterolobii]|uniref:Uncharacterized protein n=1 Tax=Meloidogyne enterolobii TaxID=390850 RepID=A0ACB0YQ66_MELEN
MVLFDMSENFRIFSFVFYKLWMNNCFELMKAVRGCASVYKIVKRKLREMKFCEFIVDGFV